MAFLKYARATLQKPGIKFAEWQSLRSAAILPDVDFQKRTARVILQEYDPSKYMLSHATIVASVDTEQGPGPLGKQYVDGFEIDRRFPDYYITPETRHYVNNNCFVPGTLITMADGTLKPIEDVQVGEMVITHRGNSRRVVRTMSREVSEELYRIKPRGTTERVVATGEHPFFVFRAVESCVACGKALRRTVHCISFLLGRHYCSKECWYKAKIPNRTLLEQKTGEFVEAQRLSRSDFSATPVLKDTVDVDLTPGQARLIGLFAAEGYYKLYAYNDNEKVAPVWAFHKSEADTLARLVRDLLWSEFRVEAKFHMHSGDNGMHVDTGANRELVKFFERWVHGSGSTSKWLDHDLLRASEAIQLEILRGWFEGDGSFIESVSDFRLTGCSGSRSLANQMQMMLHRLGVSSHLTRGESIGRKRVVTPDGSVAIVSDPSKVSVSWQVTLGAGWIHDLVEQTYYEPRYLAALEVNGGIQAVPELRYLNGYHLQMVEKVDREHYHGAVYNLEVEEDNSYLANAVAVHNCDSFERKLLLATFKTFIGAQSYIEHVQIPELSKGRIIDAAARDIGDSIYVDILIANELKHAALIRAIKAGQLGTLSMGCSVAFTGCSKCGNVAKDETQLCTHVRFFKGQEFLDQRGRQHKVAETCGHASDPTSCKFIEASWVANPAFKGAVLRSVLSAEEIASVESKLHMAFSKSAPAPIPGGISKAAFALFSQGEEQAPADESAQAPAEDPAQVPAEAAPDAAPEAGGAAPPAEQQEDPIDKAVKDLSTALRDKAIEQVRQEISKGEVNEVREIVDSNKQNESLIKSALEHPEWRRIARFVIAFAGKRDAKRVLQGLILHKNGGWRRVKQAGLTGREILAVSRVLDVMTKKSSMAGETRVYRTVLSVGGTAPYEDDETYLAACRQVLGRVMTGSEASKLLEKGRLYALGRS